MASQPMNRREVFQYLGGVPLLSGPQLGAERVTVSGLETFEVKVNHRGNRVLVRVRASAGVTGIGDASHGGDERVLELKKICAMAEWAAMPISPHGPASPVGNFAAAHVIASVPNFTILEWAYGEVPWRPEIISPPEHLEQGWLTLPERPGLGIELNERTLHRYQA